MTALPPDDTTPNAELAPRRLLEGGAGEHERSLIASARLDRVPSDAKARMAAALGGVLELQAAPSALEPAARGAALPRAGIRSVLGLLGAGIVGGIALSLWLQARPEESSNAASTPAASTSGEPVRKSPATEPASRAEPAQLAEPAPHAEPAQQRVPPRVDRSEPPRPKKRAVTAHDEPIDSGLLAEVRALEAVSSALGAAQLVRAARELDAYRRRFAHGELAIEADVLSLQLAAAQGDDEAARAGAERLLARPGAEHYRARVQALLGSPIRENAVDDGSNERAAHIRARR